MLGRGAFPERKNTGSAEDVFNQSQRNGKERIS